MPKEPYSYFYMTTAQKRQLDAYEDLPLDDLRLIVRTTPRKLREVARKPLQGYAQEPACPCGEAAIAEVTIEETARSKALAGQTWQYHELHCAGCDRPILPGVDVPV